MGNISEKLKYLETAKNKIKLAILDLGEDCGDDIGEYYKALINYPICNNVVNKPYENLKFESIGWPTNTIYGYSFLRNNETKLDYDSRLDKNIDVAKNQTYNNEWVYHNILTQLKGQGPKFVGNWNNPPHVGELVYSPKVSLKEHYISDISNMYSDCEYLEIVPDLDSGNVLNMSGLFKNCNSLWYVGKIDAVSCENFSDMFYNCNKIYHLPEIHTFNGTIFKNMFYGCASLLELPHMFTTRIANDVSNIFNGCEVLDNIPLLEMSNVKNSDGMFKGCFGLTEIKGLNDAKTNLDLGDSPMLSNLSLENIAKTIGTVPDGTKTLTLCGSVYNRTNNEIIKKIESKGWIINHSEFNLEDLRPLNWKDETINDFYNNGITWRKEQNAVNSVLNTDKLIPISGEKEYIRANFMANMRYSPVFDLNNITNTAGNVDLNGLYFDLKNLLAIPFIDFGILTEKNIDIKQFLSGCSKLKYCGGINFDGIITTTDFFKNCESLSYIGKLETKNLVDAYDMFQNCKSLTTLPKMDFSNVGNSNIYYNQINGLGNNFLKGCKRLRNVGGFTGLNLGRNSNSEDNCLDLSDCPLTHKSIRNILNELAESTSTVTGDLHPVYNNGYLKLGNRNLNLVNEADKKIAMNKRIILI